MKNLIFIGTLFALLAFSGCFAEDIDKNPNGTEISGLPCMGKDYGTLLPHPKNESKYLICISSSSLWIAPCPDKLIFNKYLGICSWDNNPPENFTASNSTVKDRPVLFNSNMSEGQALATKQTPIANSTILFAVLSTTQANEIVRKQETIAVARIGEQVPITKIPGVQVVAQQMPVQPTEQVVAPVMVQPAITVPIVPTVPTQPVPVQPVQPVPQVPFVSSVTVQPVQPVPQVPFVSSVTVQPVPQVPFFSSVTVQPVQPVPRVPFVSSVTVQPVPQVPLRPVVGVPEVRPVVGVIQEPVQPIVSVPTVSVVGVPPVSVQQVEQAVTLPPIPPMMQPVQQVNSKVVGVPVKPADSVAEVNNPFSSNFVFFKNNRILESLLKARV